MYTAASSSLLSLRCHVSPHHDPPRCSIQMGEPSSRVVLFRPHSRLAVFSLTLGVRHVSRSHRTVSPVTFTFQAANHEVTRRCVEEEDRNDGKLSRCKEALIWNITFRVESFVYPLQCTGICSGQSSRAVPQLFLKGPGINVRELELSSCELDRYSLSLTEFSIVADQLAPSASP